MTKNAIILMFSVPLLAACGGGSSSGSGSDFAGICTFSVAGNGAVGTSVDIRTSGPELAAQTESDCRAAAQGLTIARNYCGYPLRTRHFPTVERHGDVYGFDRPSVSRAPDISRQDLPGDVVSLSAGNYMLEDDVDILSCHGLADRLDALVM